MALNLISFVVFNTLSIAGCFAATMLVMAFARVLPLDLQLATSRAFAEASLYLDASHSVARHEANSDAIRIDPVNWYGRGNVLYQIGQMLNEAECLRQRRLADKALIRLMRSFA